MTPDIDFSKIRAEGGDRRDGFEEFSAQIFHRHTVPAGSAYERFRGAGGDGGVEAIWRLPTGKIIGLQSKFFLPLKAAHLGQLEKSLDTALDNFSALETYVVTLPFDPTPSIAARKGDGENEKLASWRQALISRAAKRGAHIDVEWWCASDLKSRLLGMDNSEGRILYWFGSAIINQSVLKNAAEVAEGVAGARYSPRLQVQTDADDVLRAFGQDPSWAAIGAGWRSRVGDAVRNWARYSGKNNGEPSDQIHSAFIAAERHFAALEALTFCEADRLALEDLCRISLPIAQHLEASLKADFDNEHGAENDTLVWRQYQSAYNISFPAAHLDLARDASKLFREIADFVEQAATKAACTNILLMRGPAGIGKTHTTIDATKSRITAGRAALAILGQEIAAGLDPWSVVATKLSIGPTASRAEIIGVLAVYAERTGAPFVIMIDAINETHDRGRWKAWLPQFIVDLHDQPIRLLLTCRDIFVNAALGDAGNNLVSFTHDGFAGREYDAAYAFAAFYKVGPPAEVVAQPEFANPLFLHLVCRAAQSQKWARIPGGQVSLTSLVSAILDSANVEAAKLLDHDSRFENPVRNGAIALANAMGQLSTPHIPLIQAHAILNSVHSSGGASRSLLRAMEEADLVSIAQEGDTHVLRFAFERLGDLLIAEASLEGATKANIEIRFRSGDLAELIKTPEHVAENAGLLQAYSILLPERFGIEIAVLLEGGTTSREITQLALGVLAWRELASFTNTDWVRGDGTFGELIEMLDQVLAIAAVPGHPLNAFWLDGFLRRLRVTDCDALWADVLTRAWTRNGPAHQITRIARIQDLSHMSQDSAALLATALAWMTGCADLLVRDEASQALARLLLVHPVSEELIARFMSLDDDFVRERVLAAAYGAALQRRNPSHWGEIAKATYDRLFARGMPPEHVLIRDLARLIILEAGAAGALPPTVSLSRVQPPYSSPWPLKQRFPDWQSLEANHPDLPPNMMLGRVMGPDFAIYCVKSQASAFDLVGAGVTPAQLNQWIVEQVLDLGYDGESKFALGYDYRLIEQHGDGRGVATRYRRVSKKHQWIFLGRLLGRLNDHVPRVRSGWGRAPGPLNLQGVELRTFDPTDVETPFTEQIGPRIGEFLAEPPSAPETQAPKDWVQALLSNPSCPPLSQDWALLAGYHSQRRAMASAKYSRTAHRRITARLVRNDQMAKLKAAFAKGIPNDSSPEIYRLYFGEYPLSVAYLTNPDLWPLDGHDFGSPASVVLQGSEDAETPVHSLWAPAPELVATTVATWDGARAWLDVSGTQIAMQVGSGDEVALVFDRARMANYLATTKQTLVWVLVESRTATIELSSIASADRFIAWSWTGKRVSKIGEDKAFYDHEADSKDDEEANDGEEDGGLSGDTPPA